MAKKKKEKTNTCCICGKKFSGWGNNPWGALDKDNKYIEFKSDDVCCDECNDKYVIPGRLYMYFKTHKEGM